MLSRMFGLGTLVAFLVMPALTPGASGDDKDPLTFEIFKDKEKEFRWRLTQGDSIIGTSGQGYTEKVNCKKGVDGVKKGLANDKSTFEIYEDNAKALRWRLKASNGQTVAAANKGYKTKADCEKVVDLIKKEGPKAGVVEEK